MSVKNELHFEGQPCKKCGSLIRYKSCGKCVACCNSKSPKRMMERAAGIPWDRFKDIVIEVGQKFGERTVMGPEIKRNSSRGHMCRCSCGKESFVIRHSLLNGRAQGCRRCHLRRNMQDRKLDKHPAWKTGRHYTHDGYVVLTVLYKDHPSAWKSGQIPEHRYVMEQYLGRQLLKSEYVHHRNGIRDDNRIENLELWVRSQPSGQRVDDKIAWAVEFLQQYAPHMLR